jgi:hypothetical protein
VGRGGKREVEGEEREEEARELRGVQKKKKKCDDGDRSIDERIESVRLSLSSSNAPPAE